MTIVDTIKSLPETLKKVEIADLQKQATEFAQGTIESAKGTYADVAKRGEELVNKAKSLKVEDVKNTVASLRSKAEEGVEDVQKKAEELVDDAKETVAKVTKKAPATKPAAKKPVAKKAPAKKAPAKKAPAKKAPAKKA